MFEKVMVGFDGSDRGLDALALGEILAAADGKLLVCCVHHFKGLSARIDQSEPRPDEASAERAVLGARRLLRARRAVVPVIAAGADAAETLNANAADRHAELLVLGSSHRGALGRVLAGSVTEKVLHGAVCPVAVAPADFHRTRESARPRRIVLGYDVVEPPVAALKAAAALVAQNDGELELIAVADTAVARAGGASAALSYPAIVKARLDAAEDGIARALEVIPAGVEARGTVRDGQAAEELLEVTHRADLLVVGSRARGALSRLLLGSVSDTLVRGAACPLLVVPDALERDVAEHRAGAARAAG